MASGTQVVKLRDPGSYTPCVIFSPKGRTLIGGGGSFLREWRLPTGGEVRSFDVGSMYTYAAAFSPDGKTLATGSTRTTNLWDGATGKPRHSFGGHQGEVSALVFTPDSKELLSGGNGRPIYRWEAATGRNVGVIQGPLTWNSTLALSPDGKTLAAPGGDLAVLLLDPATGKQRVKFTNHLPPRTSASSSQYVVFAPDGKTVYSSTMGIDHHIRKWETESGKEVLKIPFGPARALGLAISPDGKTLYSLTMNGPVEARDSTTGKKLRQFGKPGLRRQTAGLVAGRPIPGRWPGRSALRFGPEHRPGTVQSPGEAGLRQPARLRSRQPNPGRDHRRGRPSAFLRVGNGSDALGADRACRSGEVHRFFGPMAGCSPRGAAIRRPWCGTFEPLPLSTEPAGELSSKRLAELLESLDSVNGVAAFRAVCALARAPKQSVPLLAARFGKGDVKKIDTLIAQLGDEELGGAAKRQ